MTRALQIAGVGLLTFGALFCALILSAARSDFAFRGCGDIPRAEWEATANCSDAWFTQVLMAGLAVLCLVGAVLLWRRGQAA